MRHLLLPLFGAMLTLFVAGPADGQDDAVGYPLEIRNGALDGPGAAFLDREAKVSRFFLIGESHGNRETPELTQALLRSIRAHGYGIYAIETGPASTPHLVEAAREGGLDGALAFAKRTPFTLAFMQWKEEVETVVEAVAVGYEVWGLDQEFIGAGRFLLGRLVELAPNDAARDLAGDWRRKADEGFAAFVERGDDSRGFMLTVTDADFDALDRVFATAPDEAHTILDELRASATIYRHYREKRYYENNRDRIRLMKRHFADGLATAGDTRVLMRFGSAHMGRGYSPFDQLDLGNQAAELAYAGGLESFHLYVLAAGQVMRDGTTKDFLESAPHLAPFAAQAGERTVVFDLRPLRARLATNKARAEQPDLRDLVFRFDALLLYPEFNAAEALFPMPQR